MLPKWTMYSAHTKFDILGPPKIGGFHANHAARSIKTMHLGIDVDAQRHQHSSWAQGWEQGDHHSTDPRTAENALTDSASRRDLAR